MQLIGQLETTLPSYDHAFSVDSTTTGSVAGCSDILVLQRPRSSSTKIWHQI